MPIPNTGFYVGLTIILAIVLGMRIGMLRGKTGISILDGGNMEVALKDAAAPKFNGDGCADFAGDGCDRAKWGKCNVAACIRNGLYHCAHITPDWSEGG